MTQAKTLLMLFSLAALWGGSYLFIRVAGPELGVPATVLLRLGIAALALLGYSLLSHNLPDFRTHWQKFLVLGLLNNLIPQALIVSAVIHLNASLGSILNATTPLFTALVAAVWIKEPLGWQKALGIGLGILGVAVLVGFSPLPADSQTLLAVLESLLAAVSYGFAAVYARGAFKGIEPLHTAAGQLCGSSLLVLPIAATTWPVIHWSPAVIGSVLGLALLSTAIAYLLYFRLIATAGATAGASVTFLIPFFSVLWGVIFLAEPLSLGLFVGLGIILLSVGLVLGAKNQKIGISPRTAPGTAK